MQMRFPSALTLRRLAVGAAVVLVLAAGAAGPLAPAVQMAAGGAALAFLMVPVARFFEKRLSRPGAALAAVSAALLAAAGLLGLLLPAVVRELPGLMQSLPRMAGQLSRGVEGVAARFGVRLPDFPVEGLNRIINGLASGAMGFMSRLADGFSRMSMMLMLSYFFLRDREVLLLRLELLIPQSMRSRAVRTGRAVMREMRRYLWGQALVAGGVAALTAGGLLLIGLRGALVLGGLMGIMNMVPYFGPFIGGIPAMVIALDDGLFRAALCAGVLALVQQIDGAVLSPRIMGNLTGFSPAAVLIAIYAAGSLAGIGGMLVALPVLMAIRTVFRVFVQNGENI